MYQNPQSEPGKGLELSAQMTSYNAHTAPRWRYCCLLCFTDEETELRAPCGNIPRSPGEQ